MAVRLRIERAVRRLRFRDLEVSTDLSSEKLIDFSVSWNSRGLLGRSVDVDRVIAALSEELAAV